MSESGKGPNECLADIVIVGGGMVGCAMAAALSDYPGSIALIDSAPELTDSGDSDERLTVTDFEPRVSALTPLSQRLLNSYGAWDAIPAERLQTYQKMTVWDGEGTASIGFDAAELHRERLGTIVENSQVVRALQGTLSGQSNLDCYYQSRVTAIRPGSSKGADSTSLAHHIALESGQSLQASLIIAADGANSYVRRCFALPTREWDYGHHAIVCSVETEKQHQCTAWQRFDESGPLAFLPLYGRNSSGDSERFCSIVWSVVPDLAEQLMALDSDDFSRALEKAFESRLGAVKDVSQRHCFPLRQRHAKQYVAEGLALVGDAAHTIHPLAGQGVNQGFKDVMALAGILLSAAQDGVAVSHPLLLKRYQRQRQGDNLMMMGVMEGFKRLFEQQDPLLRWIRNAGMKWVDRQGAIKNHLVSQAMGLDLLAK